jgi:hypothetical protein
VRTVANDVPRRALISAGVATAVAIVVSALVVCYGIIPIPSYPSLAKHPDSTLHGFIAFQRGHSGELGQHCVFVVPAAGGRALQLHCESGYSATDFRWTSDGRVIVMPHPGDAPREALIFDPSSGQQVERLALRRPSFDNIDVAPLHFTREGDRVVVRHRAPDGRLTTLVSIRSPKDYRFQTVGYSPDRKHLVMTDSQGRLLVGHADGSRLAVLAMLDSGNYIPPVWFEPGFTVATVKLDDFRLGGPPRR